MRPSAQSFCLSRARTVERERDDLELLATSDDGDDPRTLLLVVGTIIREAADAQAHPASWVDGDVVIQLDRRAPLGLIVTIGRELDGRMRELFEVPFARISFDDVVRLVLRAPSIVAPGFVLLDDDTMQVSVVRWLHLFDVLDAESSDVVIDIDWDPDSTLVKPPTDELLQRMRRRSL